jgi:hypothetical protein
MRIWLAPSATDSPTRWVSSRRRGRYGKTEGAGERRRPMRLFVRHHADRNVHVSSCEPAARPHAHGNRCSHERHERDAEGFRPFEVGAIPIATEAARRIALAYRA